MKTETFCELFGEIDEKYLLEAREALKGRRPVRWGMLAACVCHALIGAIVLPRLGGTMEEPAVQTGELCLVVNEVEQIGKMDLDVRISRYQDLSAQEQEAMLLAFEQALGLDYEAVTARLPAAYHQQSFYSVDAPAVPGSGVYQPHDYVLEYQTEAGGSVTLALCAGEAPLRDYFFEESLKESEIHGVSAVVCRMQDSFLVQFSHAGVCYDVETKNISLEELEELLVSLVEN